MTTYYKVLYMNTTSTFQGTHWNLPSGDIPGEWMSPVRGDIRLCRNGYHLAPASAVSEWLEANTFVYKAEGRGDTDSEPVGAKVAFREARLLEMVGFATREILARLTGGLLTEFLDNNPDLADHLGMRSDQYDTIRALAKGMNTLRLTDSMIDAVDDVAQDIGFDLSFANALDMIKSVADSVGGYTKPSGGNVSPLSDIVVYLAKTELAKRDDLAKCSERDQFERERILTYRQSVSHRFLLDYCRNADL